MAAQHRCILNQSKEDFLAEIRIRHSHRPRELIELFAEARFQTSIRAFEVLRPPNPNYIQLIKSLNIPSLLVIGDIGSLISSEMATKLVELNDHLEVVQIKEAGHGVPYDQPDRFSIVIQNFLRSLNT